MSRENGAHPPAADRAGQAPPSGDHPSREVWECQPYDAHMPSGTVRFRVPWGFPICGGVFRVERVRTATEADDKTFAGRADPPRDEDEEREDIVAWLRFEAPAHLRRAARELADAIEAGEHRQGEPA